MRSFLRPLGLALLVFVSAGLAEAQTGNVVVTTNTSWPTGTYNLTGLTVESGAVLTIGGGSSVTVSGATLVTGSSSIVFQSINNSAQVNGVWAGAGVTLSSASVEVDSGSSINADSQGYLPTAGPGAGGGGTTTGGSYGGLGGGQTTGTYGSATAPVDLGSGGGQYQGTGTPGGGAVRLIVSGALTNNGVISANAPNVSGFVGGSAGGSVYVTTGSLLGSGSFQANGAANPNYGSGGGGGRIAIYSGSSSGYTGFASASAVGGASPNGTAIQGTVGFFDTSAANVGLNVYQQYLIPANSTLSFNEITVKNGGQLTIGGGSAIGVTQGITVTGNSSIVLQSINNSAQVNGSWAGAGVTLTAGSVEVDAGSSINADAQGYVSQAGPGASTGNSNGGSYGGLGGGQTSGIYGSATAPVDLGSGGSTYQTAGGFGGGAIRLMVSGTLTLNGAISANGGTVNGFGGGGAGGSVYVTTSGLAGAGSFAANGGSDVPNYGTGGGGGRIAVYYASAASYTGFTASSANGGTSGGAASGGTGSVGFFNTSTANDNLDVYENYPIPANSTVSYNQVTVHNGATLTIGGGSTINVAGQITVTGNSTMVLQSINNSAQVNGQWVGQGVTLNAGSVEVDAGSSINADGQGYLPQAGPGAAPAGTTYGGSYGGAGGGQAATTVNGSDTAPVSLGSGGGVYQGSGTSGGGAITLTVTGTLLNNGVISANASSVGGFAGGSAGGSVYVTAGAVTGSGSFTANGGANPSSYGNGGGGGRVAIYSPSLGGFSGFATSTANGGAVPNNNGATAGAVGTAGFFDTSAANSNLSVYQNFVIPANSTVQYNSLTVKSGATVEVGGGAQITAAQLVQVTGTMTAQAVQDQGVKITAGSLQVDSTGVITADGQGFGASQGTGGAGTGTGNGGSYGGAGGGQSPTTVYGSQAAPVDVGSGGGQYQGSAGAGGGAIQLNVSGTLTDNGLITANGGTGNGSAGGGSGGSIYVTTATLAGTGSFNANGGVGGVYGNGGGGGRVAIYSSVSATNFSGFTTSTASGGAAGANGQTAGANGTIAFFDTSVPNANVSIYQNFTVPANSSLTYNSLNLASGANLTMAGGSQLQVTQNLAITGTITAQSINNLAQVNGKWAGSGVEILAGSLTIAPTGSIIADGQGYGPTDGPGAGTSGTGNGGSYGGAGGGQSAATVYGSATAPVDLGSGGAQYQGTAGAGGGAIELLVGGTLTNNGVVSANGGTVGGFVGAGAGGSIYAAAGTLTGSGTFTANGGANTTPYGDSGGGGRIAIYSPNSAGFSASSVSVAPGTTQGDPAGSAGSITYSNAIVTQFIQPTESVIHGTATIEWFTNGGNTTVQLAGPLTATIATGTGAFSSVAFDTTKFPDGTYQLVLTVTGNNGSTSQPVIKQVVINNSVTWRSGTLTASQTWGPTPVQALDGDVIVPAGVTLTIAPGTVVKALAGAQIIVQSGGTLIATGTSSLPVTFTTFDDFSIGGDTDFNQGITVPTAGEWDGIGVLSGGTLTSNSNTVIRYAQSNLTGTLGAGTTLLATQAYEVYGTLIVPSGVTLNIQPGTVVKFNSGAGIDVQAGGSLIANGTLAQPIYLTSINDNSVGSNLIGNNTAPMPGDWNSVLIDGGTASLTNVQMQYGGGPIPSNGQEGMLETSGNATVTISDSIFAYSFYIGIQTGLNAGGDTVSVTNSIFYNNEDRAMNIYPGTTAHIVNDTFDGNSAGVFNHGGAVDLENSVVSNSISTQFGGIGLCCGGTYTALKNNDSFTTTPNVSNYVGLTDPTGTSGNISATPVYMNQAVHDYRPTYGSPLIDAANGTVPNYPLTDSFGDPRYNDPLVTAKTGTPDSNGKYPDIGAFEFVQTAPSDLDMTVLNVQGPSSALADNQVTVTWTITNVGQGTIYGPWYDAVYLVRDAGSNPVATLAGTFLEGQNAILGPGATYSGTAIVTVPGAVAGDYSWQVRTNVRGNVFEGANTANNSANSINPVSIDVPALVAGTGAKTGTLAGAGSASYYKVTPADGQAISIQAALNSVSGSIQLFVGAGYIPTPQQFDYQQVQFDSATASLVIPGASAQTYYITVYGQTLPSGSAPFSIQASLVQFSLTSVTPSTIPILGPTTVTFVGGGFTSGTTFRLVGSGGQVYSSAGVYLADEDHAQVTFNTASIPAGSYTAQAINGSTVSLANAVTFAAPSQAAEFDYLLNTNVQVTLQTPEAFRAGFPSVVTMTYTNVGGEDIPAPLLYLAVSNATLAEVPAPCANCNANYVVQSQQTYNSGLVLGINQQGPAGILPAGVSGSVQFTVTPTSGATVYFAAGASNNDVVANQYFLAYDICPSASICIYNGQQSGAYSKATDYCTSLTPTGVSAAAMSRACMIMLNNAGYTYTPGFFGQYNAPYTANLTYFDGHLPLSGFTKMLAADATQLSTQGTYDYDEQRLMGYELGKDSLADFTTRYHQGAFGYGPSHPFDITADTAGGGPTIHYPDGSARVFSIPSPTQANTYLGTVGDYGTLTVGSDGTYLLTEASGAIFHFILNGSTQALDYIQDRNGNKTQVTYTNSLVSSVSDSYGNTISFQYDSTGHITTFTDYVGRQTTYTYQYLNDAAKSTFLTSITNSSGTTNITWNTGGSNGVGYVDDSCIATFCQPAIGIASVANYDGTHTYYSYDAAGRLVGQTFDNGAQPLSFTYNSDGSISRIDGLGNSVRETASELGYLASVADPFGNTTRFHYDPEGKAIVAIGPLGDSSTFSYDSTQDYASITSPAGSLLTVNWTAEQSPLSLTDPIGDSNSFSLDSHYNILAYTAPDGIAVDRTFDTHGRVVTRTNRRGNTVTIAYNAQGLISSKTFSNGTQNTYTYDSHNNLISSTTPNGTSRYTYDSADRLKSLTNPDGTYLQFTYNAGGQRTSMVDSTGFTTDYFYDAVGRLSSLTNGSGATVVSYTYDAVGRLSTKTLANGTSEARTYDNNGNLLKIVNYSPTQAVLSEYDYTYDAEERRVTEKTPGGSYSYAYDIDGQLTSVTTPTGSIQYAYDAAGNRTSETTNGAVTAFQTNNLNEYTAAGGNSYQYDADGNLISGNGYTYTYDDENHLLTMVSATDSWSFSYDGQSNRIGAVHNGVATHYLIDPEGFTDVVTEFNAANGQPTAHYTYGLDLTSSTLAAGGANYYHFDGTGNTAQITNSSGTVVNSYAYLPFGEKTVLSSSVTNPFTYSGQMGVRDEGTGLYTTRNRLYNPTMGRFYQTDPIGLAGGLNQYEYAYNSPLNWVDPLGLEGTPPGTQTGSQSFDYVTASLQAVVGVGVQVNLHTGEAYITGSVGTGAGATAGAGHYVTSDGSQDYTGNALPGYSQSYGFVYGTGVNVVVTPGGDVAVESLVGVGGAGASQSYTVSTSSDAIQNEINHINQMSQNILFNDPNQDNVLTNPNKVIIPHTCPGCIIINLNPNKPVPVNTSIDPNGKLTSGYGNSGFVPAGAPITYTIYFENQSTATLPAQKVVVTDPLPANLNWSTLQLNQINFNNVSLTLPSNTQTYNSQAAVSTDPNPVSVSASLNPATGVLTFTLQSVDSTTGGAPANPLAGFLPPNNSANAGAGSVVFTITPQASLPNATAITNQGSIVFDANAPIATNSVTNTIDTSTITSAINPMPAINSTGSIAVSWSGSDSSGSGIASYNIYVSADSGPYTLWLSATTATSANYTGGAAGHSYTFISLATNNVGVTQSTPGTPQTVAIPLPTPVVTVTPASSSILNTQSLSVGITVAAPSGSTTAVPSGTVTLSSGSYTSAATALSSGAATIVIPAGALAPGMDTLAVAYTPDSASSVVFTAASGSASVTVGSLSTVQVSVGTSPAGQSYSVDGVSYTTAQMLTWTVGSSHTIATTSPQTASGVQQTFASWSDGGAISHTVTAPASATTYTATFSTAYLLTTAAAPAAGGTVTPASGTYYPAGTVVNLAATPASGYNFSSWTGAVASQSSATTTITMTAAQTATANFSVITAPTVSLTPASLSFTTVSGTPSAVQTVKLTNSGTASLSVSGITVTGANASSFTQTNNCGASVAIGSNCTISVTFSPTAAGSFSAAVSLADNAAGSPQTVALSGTATAPPLITPTVTVTPASQSIVSNQPLSVGITVSSSSATVPAGTVVLTSGTYSSAATALVNGAATIVVPAGSLAVGADSLAVAYTPSTAAATTFAAGSGMTSVTVAAAVPMVTLAPATLTFTSPSGIASTAQSVQLTNSGTAALTVSGITITGANAASFAQTNTCGTSVAAGATCAISVTFTPAATGSFSAAVSIADNASGSPQTVSLSGTGSTPPTFTLSATPTSQTASYGSLVTYNVTLTPQNGAFSNNVTLSAYGLPPGATATFSPATLVPGASGGSSTFSIQTTQPYFASLPANRPHDASIARPVLALAGLALLVTRRRRSLLYPLLAFVALAVLTTLSGCGSSASTSTWAINITATSATEVQTTTVSLTLH